MARQALGVAGGVIGAYFGGPVGAQIGFAIGSAIGGAIDPEEIQGPKLGEVPVQTGRDGVPIAYGWGVIHTAGNIIQKNPIVETEESTSVGKGGGTKQVTTRRTRTFAIGVCRGPIRGILRIWQNDKVVYDVRENPGIALADTQAYAEAITIYLGDDDQLPDPELESVWGVGTTPAYRGLAYVVWNNFDITDFGSAIPQYRFEVEVDGPDTITSRIYPVEAIDEIQVGISGPVGAMDELPGDDWEMTAGVGSVFWDQVLYETGPYVDDWEITAGVGSVSWTTVLLREYFEDDWEITAEVGSVYWADVRVEQFMVPEKLQVGVSAPTGSMTSV
jgi:hypothetical protein